MDEIERGMRDGVRALIGLECWGAVAGDGTALSLDFGRKFPKDRPTPNFHLPPVVRENEPEFSLFMRGTPWRVQTATGVVVGWMDDDPKDGPIDRTLERLVGSRVVRADLTAPAFDLMLEFDNGLTLAIFADGSPRSDDDDYVLFTRHWAYGVGRGGVIDMERRWLDVDLRDQINPSTGF
jgi:hypothetical protein